MLVLPRHNLARLRVVEVVKGDVKPRSCIDLNDISRLAEGALASGRPLQLLRDRRWQIVGVHWIPRARVIQSYPC